MKRVLVCIVLLMLTFTVRAIEPVDTLMRRLSEKVDQGYQEVKRIVSRFDWIDTTYIEPQHYNFTVMLQATHNYDLYTLRSIGDEPQSVTFSPDSKLKVGPYFGWRWIFAGYTFELSNISLSNLKQEFVMSVYTSQIGVDLFYRRTGTDYKIRNVRLGRDVDVSHLNGASFGGIKAGITGFNAYYIFNHGRFSYPAAFSQSTIQKVSCGSWMAGIGYTNNTLSFDHEGLQYLADERLGRDVALVDSGLMFDKVKYNDFNISGGYAYNWVFSRHWLFGASIQAAIAYKRSSADVPSDGQNYLGFVFENVNLDGIGRFGIIYNNMRWYAGASVIVHSNNYRKPRFHANNTFGSMNLYIGYNFGLKKQYRKKHEKKNLSLPDGIFDDPAPAGSEGVIHDRGQCDDCQATGKCTCQ